MRIGLAHTIDPKLELYKGPQFPPQGRTNFGVFLDSSPDLWGRTLMQRREAIRARNRNEKPRTLLESDFLLGVHDFSRSGGLRFSTAANGPFLDNNDENAAPPLVSLRTLEHAQRQALSMSKAVLRLDKFTGVHHTLLSRRFDRTDTSQRVHFASAMTLLDRTDGDDYAAGVSYLDIAGLMTQISSRTEHEHEELWRRLLFNVLVSSRVLSIAI